MIYEGLPYTHDDVDRLINRLVSMTSIYRNMCIYSVRYILGSVVMYMYILS